MIETNIGMEELSHGMESVSITDGVGGEYACSYCGIYDPACVVMCNSTKKWFCNGHASSSGSHIVHHLVRSRNSQVTLHPASPNGNHILECRACGCRNVFMLGYIDEGDDDAGNLPVLICRYPCVNRNVRNWDPESWVPIIQEHQFVSRIVKVPSLDCEYNCNRVTISDMVRLEERWQKNPEATLSSLNSPDDYDEEEPIESVKLSYESVDDYYDTFERLVTLEADNASSMQESIKMEGVVVQWTEEKYEARYAQFQIPKEYEDQGIRLTPGDRLEFAKSDDDGGDSVEAFVTNLSKDISGEITVLVKNVDQSFTKAPSYCIRLRHNFTPYSRMKNALNAMFRESEIQRVMLGSPYHPSSDEVHEHVDYSVPGLPPLNPSQNEAVAMALRRSFTMIQGPPGTGKTITAATILFHLSRMNKGPILAAAPSNTAVDQLCLKLADSETNLNVVRVCALSREYVESPVEHLTLHYMVQNVDGYAEFKDLKKKRDFGKGLTGMEEDRFRTLREEIENEILDKADIICTTCVNAGARFLNFPYHAVLVDEATQATEPECLIPLMLATNQVVLVGDHCQLGPVVTCLRAAKAGLTQSLFERMVFNGNQPFRLQTQYRMHPALSVFPSSVFYEGTLKNGVTVAQRTASVLFPWPKANKPMFFYSVAGKEEISGGGVSFLNRRETVVITDIITRLLREGVDPKSIGVITPYVGQRIYIEQYLNHKTQVSPQSYAQVEISSVDAFQGREKDYIILSCVRANNYMAIGFLNDPRRLNVAITRAKFGTIIVGNPHVLCKWQLWNHMLHYFRNQHLLVEGDLDSLRECDINLPKLKPYTFRPRPIVSLPWDQNHY